jgi:hypothetical protein
MGFEEKGIIFGTHFWIQHWRSVVLVLIQGRSQIITLRGSYIEDCRWKHVRWSLVETWSRLSGQGIVGYCNSMVWLVWSSGGLVESLDHNNMLCGRLPTPWLDF